jgi:hypothetical protein
VGLRHHYRLRDVSPESVAIPLGFPSKLSRKRAACCARFARSSALGVWTFVLLYTRDPMLDGFCPPTAIDEFAADETVEELVRQDLLARVERDGREGVVIINYAKHNEIKAQIERRLELDRGRKDPSGAGRQRRNPDPIPPGIRADSDRVAPGAQTDSGGIPPPESESETESEVKESPSQAPAGRAGHSGRGRRSSCRIGRSPRRRPWSTGRSPRSISCPAFASDTPLTETSGAARGHACDALHPDGVPVHARASSRLQPFACVSCVLMRRARVCPKGESIERRGHDDAVGTAAPSAPTEVAPISMAAPPISMKVTPISTAASSISQNDHPFRKNVTVARETVAVRSKNVEEIEQTATPSRQTVEAIRKTVTLSHENVDRFHQNVEEGWTIVAVVETIVTVCRENDSFCRNTATVSRHRSTIFEIDDTDFEMNDEAIDTDGAIQGREVNDPDDPRRVCPPFEGAPEASVDGAEHRCTEMTETVTTTL